MMAGGRRSCLNSSGRSWRPALSEDAAIVAAGEPITGVVSWFGPERHGPSPDAMGAHGFGAVTERSGPDATGRLLAMFQEIEANHERLATEPHMRLEFFRVTPAAQGTGIGTALIEHGHRRADKLGIACYLETFTEPNVRLRCSWLRLPARHSRTRPLRICTASRLPTATSTPSLGV